MKVLTAITDPTYDATKSKSELDKFFIRLLRDERDLPFVCLTLKITFTLVPLGVLLYFPFVNGLVWWLMAAVYFFLNNFYFKGPFGLMFHCTSHRIWFKKKYNALNYYLPWFIGPFFGQTPETYFSHHIGMHHLENNLPDDKSTTMPYQRDSIFGFIRYFSNFFFLGLIELSQYFYRKNRRKLMYKSIFGEFSFILMCIGLCFVSWEATLVVFILPFVISRIIMMLGNFAQHAFVDANDPGNDYRNSITCINTSYNHKCWNDGYHISHHEKPAMHWTEHPVYFQQTIDKYKANEAIVFDGIHFLHVFFYLMRKRYDLLAKNYVNLDNRFSNDEEVVAFLKSRTKSIPIYNIQTA
jgi:fatty acid desaturase